MKTETKEIFKRSAIVLLSPLFVLALIPFALLWVIVGVIAFILSPIYWAITGESLLDKLGI